MPLDVLISVRYPFTLVGIWQSLIDQLVQPILQAWTTPEMAALSANAMSLAQFALQTTDHTTGPHAALLQSMKTLLVVARSTRVRRIA